MKGGYRCGAGRPASRPQTSWASRLDVRRLVLDGSLNAGTTTTWRWSNGLLATLAADTDHLLITYRFKFAEGEREVQSLASDPQNKAAQRDRALIGLSRARPLAGLGQREESIHQHAGDHRGEQREERIERDSCGQQGSLLG